jgi:hypothetical protein
MSQQFGPLLCTISIWALPAIIAITFHEAAHGFAALRLGDDTALRLGRVTFNPLKHIDPFGTILLPALLLFLHSRRGNVRMRSGLVTDLAEGASLTRRRIRQLLHSPLMFAALTMGHQRSISAFCRAPSASGVCCSRGKNSSPRSANRRRTAGSAIASTAAAFSLPMMSLGVPLGAHNETQDVKYAPAAPASSTVGMLGAASRWLLAMNA